MQRFRNQYIRRFGAVVVALCAATSVQAKCPAVLSEAAALGEPPHSAQVVVNASEDCPKISRVEATLFAGDESIVTRTYGENELFSPTLVFAVRDSLRLPAVAGVYRIDWRAQLSDGQTQKFSQTFTVPCQAPAEADIFWDDADATMRIEAPGADRCEGKTLAELTLQQLSGEPLSGKYATTYQSIDGEPVQATISLPDLEGERRYAGVLRLTNASELSIEQPVEFVTGCGDLVPTATVVGNRMLGSVQASSCQFPVTMKVSVLHESGAEIKSINALLKSDEFDFELPDFSDWPAGDYSIETQFIGLASRAKHQMALSVACSDPTIEAPTLALDDTLGQANVAFALRSRESCQDRTRISLQVRDIDGVVVFNRSEEFPPGTQEQLLNWPFRGIPGTAYDLDLTVNYGVAQSSSLTETARAVYECTPPSILGFGYANADASHLSGLIALTQCNAPSSAKLVVQNEGGRVVVDASPQITQDLGKAYAQVAPVSLGHLDSGVYRASLVVSDNRSRTDTASFTVQRDIDGPTIAFYHGEHQIEDGEIPAVEELADLSLKFQDSNAPMASFHSAEGALTSYPGDAAAQFLRVEGEATPQVWLSGTIDVPRSDVPPALVGVLARAPTGEYWMAPISRQFVPTERVELKDYYPSRRRMAFRSVVRVQPLAAGRYELAGVVVNNPSGESRLISGSGSFDVSALSAQQHDAILRQGVTEIPIALHWSAESVASLERVTSVPDGDYTLSVIGRDVFGNISAVHSQVIRLNQEKRQATLDWPAIANYRRSFQHKFRDDTDASRGPLRVLYRRVSGYGEIRINGSNVSEQTSEDLLTPSPDGSFAIDIELVNDDVDARFVVHADATDVAPLELTVQTYRPEFVTQRKRTVNNDVLSINHRDQPCRHVVFDELADVSLRANEVLCAVRLQIPGTSVVSTSEDRTEVRLPPGVSNDNLYEEGFVSAPDGFPVFTRTRLVAIKDMQAYSSTPQIEFEPLVQWRSRAKPGKFLTNVGDVVAGHIVVRAGLGTPLVFVNNEPIELPADASGTYRLPIRTETSSLGEVFETQVRAYYPDSPELVAERTFQFAAVPDRVFVQAVSGDFVSPGNLQMSLQILAGGQPLNIASHGAYRLDSADVIRRHDGKAVSVSPTVNLDSSNRLHAGLGALPPGDYRLQLTLVNTDPRFTDHLGPIKTETAFEVLDGSPVAARLFTFRQTDITPFFGQLSVDYENGQRRSDVERVSWEISDDGKAFEPWQCCGSSVDFALADPGVKYYRAQLTNRHSKVTSYTPSIRVNAYLSGHLEVDGPRNTFRGYPATYSVSGLPAEYEVLWRVTAPNATKAVEHRASTLTIPADETGVYVVEVVADTETGNPDSRSALRTFFTLNAAWPRLPESVIAGPTQVEYGKVATFTVTHPPIFRDRGNETIKRQGEWQLPDGTRVDDDEWAQFTLRELPAGDATANILYHTWIEDDPTTLTTAVHRIEPITYRWPNWKLKVATTSVEPPAILRLSVTPEDWRQWMGLADSPITTFWDLPDHVRILDRTPTEAIVYAVDDRDFDVVARITDPRGNVTELERTGIRPLKQIPFEVSLSVVAERTLHTAPLQVTAKVDPIVLPKDRKITRAAFYVNGLYRGVSDGAPLKLQLRTPGEHELRVIASIDSEFTSDDTVTLTIGENHRAECTISPVGNFRLNGLAKAQCDDPDGHMVEYRWYANGQLLSDSGTRVQLSRADRIGLSELSLVAMDNAGMETRARYTPPQE